MLLLNYAGGTAQGLFTLMGAMATVAPTILGLLYSSDVSQLSEPAAWYNVFSPTNDLGGLLIGAVCFAYLSCAFCFGMAAMATPSVDKGTSTHQKPD
jgi:hypothetical protein